jgi:alpha-glucosidase
LARKAGNKWYVACINGENKERTIDLDLSLFKKQKGLLIKDGTEPLTFSSENIGTTTKKQIVVQPNGGFVVVLE